MSPGLSGPGCAGTAGAWSTLRAQESGRAREPPRQQEVPAETSAPGQGSRRGISHSTRSARAPADERCSGEPNDTGLTRRSTSPEQ